MSNTLIVNVSPGQTRVALVENGVVAEVFHERAGGTGITGNIYKGRVVRVLPGMQAAFVDIGIERSGFLYVDDVGNDATTLPEGAAPVDGEEEDEPVREAPRLRAVDGGEEEAEKRERVPIEHQLTKGQEVVVQIAKGPIGTKGARVTTRLSLPGRMLVLMPHVDHVGVSRRIEDPEERTRLRELIQELRPPGVGIIVRTAAEGEDREALRTDIEVLIALWNDLVRKKEVARSPSLLFADLDLALRCIRDLLTHNLDRVVVDAMEEHDRIHAFATQVAPRLSHRVELYDGAEPIFDAFSVEDEINRALQPKVWLRSGGYLVIDRTEALTTIDVNTGRYVGRRNLDETFLKTNLEAVPEVVYQLRLRNVGGIIVIDFIDMEREEHREKVVRALEEALSRDRLRTVVHSMSDLGLVEMTRKRAKTSLLKTLTDSCPYCEGHGYVRSVATMGYDVVRDVMRAGRNVTHDSLGIHVHPQVADFLCGEGRALMEEAERLLAKHLVILPVSAYHVEDHDIIGVDTGLVPDGVIRAVSSNMDGGSDR